MRVMNRRERRKAGVTFFNVLRIVKAMSAEEREDSPAVMATVVLEKLAGGDAQKLFENIDWDKLLEIIERLIELILKFLPYFM